MSAPQWVATEMVELLADLAARQPHRARERYVRIAEDPDVLLPVMCGWAKAVAADVPGPGVVTFDIEMVDGTTPGPRQLAIGRVIACMGNDDPQTALDVLHALQPLDVMLAGWDIACMAAEVWSAAGGGR